MKEKYRYTIPVEMPRSTHYGNNYYVIPSRKLGHNVTAFSYLEYCNIIRLEMDSKVEFYCEQPCKVDVFVDGMMYSTTFDTYVFTRTGVRKCRKSSMLKNLLPTMREENAIEHRLKTEALVYSEWHKLCSKN